jgi:hypothetical protein
MALTDSDIATAMVRQDFERPVLRRGQQIAEKEKTSPGYAAAAAAVSTRRGPWFSFTYSAWQELCAKWGNVGGDETLNQQHPICNRGRRLLAELAAGKEILVSAVERASRQAVCSKCPWNKSGHCLRADCRMGGNIGVITKYATEDCPLGRWPKHAAPPDP